METLCPVIEHKNGAAGDMENRVESSQNLKELHQVSNYTSGYISKRSENKDFKRYLYAHIPSSVITMGKLNLRERERERERESVCVCVCVCVILVTRP
jgi:hypothetical protein